MTPEDLIKEAKRQILDLQVTIDTLDALLAPKETPPPTLSTRKRRYFPEWSTLKGSNRGIFRAGMAGHVATNDGKVAVMLTADLDFKVIQPGHPLEGRTYDSPSELCSKVMNRKAANGFEHTVLDGRSLKELRDLWMHSGLVPPSYILE